MGLPLANKPASGSLDGLLKTNDNQPITVGSLKTVSDGQGNDTALRIGPSGVGSSGTLTAVGAFGYAAGAGGTAAQPTSRTTGVTLNKICGTITTSTASLAVGLSATFVVTNSTVAVDDVVILSIRSGATNAGTTANITAVAAGSFQITVSNRGDGTAEVGAIAINFAVITAVAA